MIKPGVHIRSPEQLYKMILGTAEKLIFDNMLKFFGALVKFSRMIKSTLRRCCKIGPFVAPYHFLDLFEESLKHG